MEMGYVPNFMARRLSARHSQTIGVIVPKIAHFFFSKVIQAIYDAAFENKYEILLMVSQENAEREALHVQTLLSMRVDGLIVSISQETKSASVFKPVVERGVPLTFMDRALKLAGSNTVVTDDRGGRTARWNRQSGGIPQNRPPGRSAASPCGERALSRNERSDGSSRNRTGPCRCRLRRLREEDGYGGLVSLLSRGRLPECLFAVSFLWRSARSWRPGTTAVNAP